MNRTRPGGHTRIRTVVFVVVCLFTIFSASAALAQDVTPAEISRIRYELAKVEQKLKNAGGTRIELNDYDRKAFAQVKEAAEKDPENPRVIELVADARRLYNDAKGVLFEITPEMLAYRQRESVLSTHVATASKEKWTELESALQAIPRVENPFPVLTPPDVDAADYQGRSIVLEGINYEPDLFVQMGRNWIAAGDESQGYYFIDAGGREFNCLFEALRRYRNQIQNQIDVPWTIVGAIDGPCMLAPEATRQQAGTPHVGWRIRINAIHIPDVVTITLDESHEAGAVFAGEEQLAEMKSFSVTSVPDDVSPVDLLKIYIAAVKEKNWDLHLECIEAEQREFSGQIDSLRYNWEVQQKGLERSHCHAEPMDVSELKIVQGRVDEELDDFFGDDTRKRAEIDRIEKVVVTVRLFNERGEQTVRPRYVTLIRRNEGRWYIYSGATLLF